MSRYHSHVRDARIVVVDADAWREPEKMPHGVLQNPNTGAFFYNDPELGHTLRPIGSNLSKAISYAKVASSSGVPAFIDRHVMSAELEGLLLDLTEFVGVRDSTIHYEQTIRSAKKRIGEEILKPHRNGHVSELLSLATRVQWHSDSNVGLCVPIHDALRSCTLCRLIGSREHVQVSAGLVHFAAIEHGVGVKRLKHGDERHRAFAETLLENEMLYHFPRKLYATMFADNGLPVSQYLHRRTKRRESVVGKPTAVNIPPCITMYLKPVQTRTGVHLKWPDRLAMSAFVVQMARRLGWQPSRVMAFLPLLAKNNSTAEFHANMKRDYAKVQLPPLKTCRSIQGNGHSRWRCAFLDGVDGCGRTKQLPKVGTVEHANLNPAIMATLPEMTAKEAESDSE